VNDCCQPVINEFAQRLSEFMGVIQSQTVLVDCVNISRHAMAREYYKALMLCRKLIDYEDTRLGNVASGVSEGDPEV